MAPFLRGLVVGSVASTTCYAVYSFLTAHRSAPHSNDVIQDLGLQAVPRESPLLEDVHKLEKFRSILKYGVPDRGPLVRFYDNHVLAYDQAKKTPIWVAEYMTKESLKGNANRKHAKFKSDPTIPGEYDAKNSDYLGSGWSRGHMSPAGDNKCTQAAMDETFYLSNIVPQNLDNNAGFWNRFEMYCRDLTDKFSAVTVITGPLMLSSEEEGKSLVKYWVIGKSKVAVPTHLYKVVVAEPANESQPRAVGAFIVPNEPISFDHKLVEYQVPLDQLESEAGINFLPRLNKNLMVNLCSVDSCQLLNKDGFDLYVINRKLANATTLQRLETAWKELADKKLKPDSYSQNTYNRKKQELHKDEEQKKSEL